MSDPVGDLERAAERMRQRIDRACRRAGRDPSEVRLVAVTKSVPIEVIRRAAAVGLHDFGENYAAELAEKATAVPATWHFIGALQTGTASKVAEHAAVIHSARPGRALDRVVARSARRGARLRALIQVDFTGARQGVPPEDAGSAAAAIAGMEGLDLVGLMTLPPWTGDPEGSRLYFAQLRAIRDHLRQDHPDVLELSMGMSADCEVAIEEGATMVRVGTALFGPRPAPP
jgi:PLP dependent protein